MNQQITGTDILEVAKTIAATAVKVTQIEQVIEFNQRVLRIEQRSPALLNASEYDISVRCLREEIDEFIEAHHKGDMIGCVDAMVDLRYFSTGVLYKMGLTAGAVWHYMRASKKATDFVAADRPDMLQQSESDSVAAILHGGVENFSSQFGRHDLRRCIEAIVDLYHDATQAMGKMGLSTEAIADCDTAVHNANILKKLGSNAKRAVDGAADAVKPADWVDPSVAIGEIIDREIAKAQVV